MNTLAKLALDIRIALATHPKVTVNHPQPKRLWRWLKKELPVCDVTFDERAVHVSWEGDHMKTAIDDHPTVLELRADTAALKQLADLEELASVPPERGGYRFSEWEHTFIRSVREWHDRTLEFTTSQRAKIKEIWQAADLRQRAAPDEKAQNLFSNLSPARQTEMRERAKRVKLPWE